MRNQKMKTNIIIAVLIVSCITVGAMIINSLRGSSKTTDIIDKTQAGQADVKVDIEQPQDKQEATEEDSTEVKPKEELQVEEEIKEDEVIPKQESEEVVQQQVEETTHEEPIVEQEPSQTEKADDKPEQSNDQQKEPVTEEPKVEPQRTTTNDDGDNLVPDSENPFKQPLKPLDSDSGLGKDAKGADYYQDGVPAGQGDKF